jgi:hypothetical protein
MIRKPAVAGQFYPGTEESLRKAVESYLMKVEEKIDAVGIVSPHAGYIYSGPVAGATFSSINIPEVTLIISPNHTGFGKPCAIMTEGEWQTPLGSMPIETTLARKLLDSSATLKEDSTAHEGEHSLEVQLPFIQYIRRDCRLVPLTVMSLSYGECEKLGDCIADVIKQTKIDVLIVASSDMTHYESHSYATSQDRKAIEQMEKLNPKGLYDVVNRERISMCGNIPVTIMLCAAKKLGVANSKLIKYSTSAETSGDYDRVVGYAGLVVW